MIIWLITIFFGLTSLTPSPPEAEAQTPEQDLKPRQVIVRTEVAKGAEYPLKVKGVLLIESGPEVVWGVLTDYDHLEGVFPGLEKSRILKKDAGEVLVEQQYRGLIFLSRSMVFSSRETPMQKIDFQRLGGKSRVAGYWSLESVVGGSTRVTMEVAVRPRRFLPIWLVGGKLRSQVPHGLISIRQKSLTRLNKDSSGDPEIIYVGQEQEDPPSQEGF
ncbi:MAG: SRPBCC family protein [Candidatus Brocadiales bacterium]